MVSTASAASAQPASRDPPVNRPNLHVTTKYVKMVASARQREALQYVCVRLDTLGPPVRQMWMNAVLIHAGMGDPVLTWLETTAVFVCNPSRDLSVRQEATWCLRPASPTPARTGAPVWMLMRDTCVNALKASWAWTAERGSSMTVSAGTEADAWVPTPPSASVLQASSGSFVNLKSQPRPAT